jgi:hypothetical protein
MSRPDPIYPATKALSVYNVLAGAGRPLTAAEVLWWLRQNWDRKLPDDYAEHGAAYLLEHGFARQRDGKLSVPHVGGKPKRIKRTNDDHDLAWA